MPNVTLKLSCRGSTKGKECRLLQPLYSKLKPLDQPTVHHRFILVKAWVLVVGN